ncbi:MAG: type II secretion system protein [Candidatus Saccharimonas sp.]
MSKQELKQRGFTIIEVVLVLAIAALIFLMVFIALPALQRNQRDQSRKDELGKVVSAINTYQSNKGGANPTNGIDLNGYIDGVAATNDVGEKDSAHTVGPSDAYIDNNYYVTVKALTTDGSTGNADTNIIQVFTSAKCNATNDGAVRASKRSAAVMIQLENGDSIFCASV